jgi:hypothetical protein
MTQIITHGGDNMTELNPTLEQVQEEMMKPIFPVLVDIIKTIQIDD